MTQTALDTIHRGYSALFFHDDPRVELLMVENQEVLPFNPLRPASSAGQEASRRNMLMIGHLTSGDIRATLCSDGYLALGDFYQRVTSWGGGVHALVSGDSSRKQRQYLAWLKKRHRQRDCPCLSAGPWRSTPCLPAWMNGAPAITRMFMASIT